MKSFANLALQSIRSAAAQPLAVFVEKMGQQQKNSRCQKTIIGAENTEDADRKKLWWHLHKPYIQSSIYTDTIQYDIVEFLLRSTDVYLRRFGAVKVKKT